VGDGPELFKATWGLWFNANLSTEFDQAVARAEELLALGQRLGDEDLLVEAYHCRWSTAYFRGDTATALQASREGIARYNPARHGRLGAEFGGHDPGVCALGVQSQMLCFSGFVDQAVRNVDQIVALAERLNHPPSLAHGLLGTTMTYQLAGDRQSCYRLANRWAEVSGKHNFPPQRALGIFFSGWGKAAGATLAEGLEMMETAYPATAAMQSMLFHNTALLAEVRAKAGRVSDGLALVTEALQRAKDPEIGYYLPEIYRLRGELLLASSPGARDEAERCYHTAIRIARQQGAVSLQLRAAMSIARFWASAGRPENGIASLRETYATFTEGFDTPDLVEARQLLSS
jgi:predicted ATPase